MRRSAWTATFEKLEARQLLAADLSAAFASLSPQVVNGSRELIAFDVTNPGSANVQQNFSIQMFLIPAGTAFSADTARLLATFQKSVQLKAGATAQLTLNTPIGIAVPTGTYQLVAVLHPANANDSADDVIAQSGAFDVMARNIDLTTAIAMVRPTAFQATLAANGTVRITLANAAGSLDTLPPMRVQVQIALRPASAPDGSGDLVLKNVSVSLGSLKPGASQSIVVPISFPSNLAAGTFSLIATGDSASAVAETSETNNVATLPQPILVTSPTVTPAPAGSTITLGRTPPVTGASTSPPTVSPGTFNNTLGTTPTTFGQTPIASAGMTPVNSTGQTPINMTGTTPTTNVTGSPITIAGTTPIHVTGTTPINATGLTPVSVGLAPIGSIGQTPLNATGLAPSSIGSPPSLSMFTPNFGVPQLMSF